ncbi:MAG: ABC transporter permease [Hyphomicrobiales bacterium]
MSTLLRGWRGVIRAPLRSTLVFVLLGASMGLALVMLTVNGAFAERIDDVESEIGTTITVQPAAQFLAAPPAGGGGTTDAQPGGPVRPELDPLTTADAEQIAAIDGVVSVVRTARETLMDVDTDLESGLRASDIGATVHINNGDAEEKDPQLPVAVVGTDSSSLNTNFASDGHLTSGRALGPDDADANVAIIGKALAEKNGLEVGDTFEIEGEEVEVVGIFDSAQALATNAMLMPFDTVQRLFDLGGDITALSVEVAKPGLVQKVQDQIAEIIDDRGTIVSDIAEFDRVAGPLSDAKSSSGVALVAALIVAACVILFSVALVVRQRIREIGILKAIGASTRQVTMQLGSEAAFLSIGAALLGTAIAAPIAGTVADGLVSDPPPAAEASGPFASRPGGAIVSRGIQFGDAQSVMPGAGAEDDSTALESIDAAVSLKTLGYALGLGVALAVVAAAIPAWYSSRVRPAEVLRYE